MRINEKIIDNVWNNKTFKDIYKKLFLESVAKAINIDSIRLEEPRNIDLFSYQSKKNSNLEEKEFNYLLKVAALFSETENKDIQNASLRIAQHSVINGNNAQRKAGYMVLDMLVNKPSIKLATEREYLTGNEIYDLPLKFNLGRLKREQYYCVELNNDEKFYTTKFQRRFWNAVSGKDNLISISAPTSSGKSFIVRKWLKQILDLAHHDLMKNVVIIVPTRALINQFENDFNDEFIDNRKLVEIITMPFLRELETNKTKKVYIFTQERLSIFLNNSPKIIFDAVFVDEAHKISDGDRGVLLQNTLESILLKNSTTKIVFASPFTKNPDKVFIGAKALKSQLSTVNQNIFYINEDQKVKGQWGVEALFDKSKVHIGKICFEKRLSSIKKKMASIAYKIGHGFDGNLIYADGGGKAEEYAEELYNLIPDEEICENDELINNLIVMCKDIVHNDFILAKFLKKRIAVHYGSMPHLLRLEIEKLYRKRKIRYLICTSTLLEGVNLACQNIFMRDPKKGTSDMSPADIFNLSGRAGRLSKEFFGNIFFIDWECAPTSSTETDIKRATERMLKDNFDDIIASYDVTNIDKLQTIKSDILSMSGYIFNKFIKTNDVSKCNEIRNVCTKEQIDKLNNSLKLYKENIKIPDEILIKHPTMYHYSMQMLLERFEEKFNKDGIVALQELVPAMPDDSEYSVVYNNLIGTLHRIGRYFANAFPKDMVPYAAMLSSQWMYGYQISRLIAERREYNKKKGRKESFNTSVRTVFKDVEDIARYKVPRFLSCYVDTLNYFLKEKGKNEWIKKGKDFSLYLEFGVSEKTHVSMILLGVSRATITTLASLKNQDVPILPKNLSEADSLVWLRKNISLLKSNFTKNISKLQVEELNNIISNYK